MLKVILNIFPDVYGNIFLPVKRLMVRILLPISNTLPMLVVTFLGTISDFKIDNTTEMSVE